MSHPLDEGPSAARMASTAHAMFKAFRGTAGCSEDMAREYEKLAKELPSLARRHGVPLTLQWLHDSSRVGLPADGAAVDQRAACQAQQSLLDDWLKLGGAAFLNRESFAQILARETIVWPFDGRARAHFSHCMLDAAEALCTVATHGGYRHPSPRQVQRMAPL